MITAKIKSKDDLDYYDYTSTIKYAGKRLVIAINYAELVDSPIDYLVPCICENNQILVKRCNLTDWDIT